MARIFLQFSKRAVSRAGDILISSNSESDKYREAVEVVNNWRESHDFPLRVIRNTLSKRANNIAKSKNKSPDVAARLKRLPSIHNKLVRPESKALSSVQDIAGCRVIFKTVEEAYDLLQVYLKEQARNSTERPVCIKFTDYILHPKESGYRSLHLIRKYQSSVESCVPFNGHKIEIQIRSQLQHHWATAVETASTFLGEGLKSSSGDSRWLRFFALAGSVFAIIEGRQPVPNTPGKQMDLISEIRNLWYELQVDTFLKGCTSVAQRLGEFKGSKDFLLVFDASTRSVKIRGFAEGQNEIATKALAGAELKYADQPEIQSVLVTVDSVEKLRDTYPNFHSDALDFIDALSGIIEPEYLREERPELEYK